MLTGTLLPCLVIFTLDDACVAKWPAFFEPCSHSGSGIFEVVVQRFESRHKVLTTADVCSRAATGPISGIEQL